jgi:hypothetical protein
MKIPMFLVISIFIVVLIGYGERCEANDINAFVQACLSWLNWEKPMCECAAQEADKRHTSQGFDYLVALMNKDEAKAKKLLGQLDMPEKMDVNLFFLNTEEWKCMELEGN